MTNVVFNQGTVDVSVPASQKIAVLTDGTARVYSILGYPNFPGSVNDLGEVENEETVFGTFSSDIAVTVRIESTSAAPVYYEVGSDPVVGTPTGSLQASATPFAVTGLSSTQGGTAALVGGTSSTSGNAGGAASLTGGVPGATGVGGAAAVAGGAGGSSSGKGGAASVAGGAGTAGNGSGGSVILTGGAKNGSGLDGAVINRGTFQLKKLGTPATATDTASLSDAQMVAGLIVATPTAAAAYTVRTGTQLKAALPTDLAAGDAFDLTIINLGGTGDDITLTAATDITIVGDPVIGPIADVATEQSSVGTFRIRFVTGTTFVAYRVG